MDQHHYITECRPRTCTAIRVSISPIELSKVLGIPEICGISSCRLYRPDIVTRS